MDISSMLSKLQSAGLVVPCHQGLACILTSKLLNQRDASKNSKDCPPTVMIKLDNIRNYD